jgi:hypothetical protein
MFGLPVLVVVFGMATIDVLKGLEVPSVAMPEAGWIALLFGAGLFVLVGIDLMALLFYVGRDGATSGCISRTTPAQFPPVIVTMPGRH